jgi:hypothetical protein
VTFRPHGNSWADGKGRGLENRLQDKCPVILIVHHLDRHRQRVMLMNSLRTIDTVFTVVILALGILMYLHYQDYKPEILTKEDVASTINEVEKYTDIKPLKDRYINHVKKNFKNHQVVDTLIEYVLYLFVGVVVFLLLSIAALYKMEKRH